MKKTDYMPRYFRISKMFGLNSTVISIFGNYNSSNIFKPCIECYFGLTKLQRSGIHIHTMLTIRMCSNLWVGKQTLRETVENSVYERNSLRKPYKSTGEESENRMYKSTSGFEYDFR